ncbi:MAG: pyridoxal phosphate-dependent aminotransferase [Halobacteria archaeon]
MDDLEPQDSQRNVFEERVSERVNRVPPSGIRRFFELAEELDDVISLGVGEPDFSAPWSARQAAIESLELGKTSYTTNRGRSELRELISRKLERYGLSYRGEDEILVTTGVSEGLDLAFRALLDPGQKAAVPDPSYVSYVPGVVFADGEPVAVETSSEEEFKLRYSDLEQAGAADCELLLLCYPNNPTGAVMREDDLEEVAEFVRENDLLVLSDEVYADLTYEGGHCSIATLEGMRERTVVFNGFSKAYAMTGMRLGYAAGPPEVIGAMNKIHQYSMLSSPITSQFAAIDALEWCEDEVVEMRRKYDRRRRFVLSRLDELGIDCFESKGAFYVFPECPHGSEEEFAEKLLEAEGVAVVPGDVFGPAGEGHLRLSYATGMEELKEAFRRIERFLEG